MYRLDQFCFILKDAEKVKAQISDPQCSSNHSLSRSHPNTHICKHIRTEFFLVAGTAILHLSLSPLLLPLTFSSSLLLFLFSLAQSLLCQQLLYLFWSLFWIIIVSVLSFLTFIAMRLGISSFISDILSTSSNICFCWTEGKVELNLYLLAAAPTAVTTAVLFSKAVGFRASEFCWEGHLLVQSNDALLCCCRVVCKNLLCAWVLVCRNLSLLPRFASLCWSQL